MPGIVVVLVVFILALVLRLRGMSVLGAWFISMGVVPFFVLLNELVVANPVGEASMWPIALVVAGAYGAAAGGLGTLVASVCLKLRRGRCRFDP